MVDEIDCDEDTTTVEFISGADDARLRLDCFRAIVTTDCPTFEGRLECAKRLYGWVMELASDEGQEEPVLETLEDQCERRH